MPGADPIVAATTYRQQILPAGSKNESFLKSSKENKKDLSKEKSEKGKQRKDRDESDDEDDEPKKAPKQQKELPIQRRSYSKDLCCVL